MFTHLSKNGNPEMVDVSSKQPSLRRARATAFLNVDHVIADALRSNDMKLAKGPVFDTAILAGIMACKRTSDLIPLCHHISLQDCGIDIQFSGENQILIESTVTTIDRTGVEMEALTAVTVAALTVYDMCKGLSQKMEITGVRLIEKTGGKSDISTQEVL